MSFDDKVLAYEMNDNDKLLAEIAKLIVWAYNGERKPHIIPHEKEVSPPYYRWKHSPLGYSLIISETEDFGSAKILTTNEHINDFVEHVFLVLVGDTSVEWTKIVNTSDAVKYALNKHFGMEVELSNIGYDHKFDTFGVPKLPIKPTIWANRIIDDTAFKEMEEKGFTYFERDLWEIEL